MLLLFCLLPARLSKRVLASRFRQGLSNAARGAGVRRCAVLSGGKAGRRQTGSAVPGVWYQRYTSALRRLVPEGEYEREYTLSWAPTKHERQSIVPIEGRRAGEEREEKDDEDGDVQLKSISSPWWRAQSSSASQQPGCQGRCFQPAAAPAGSVTVGVGGERGP